MRSNTKKKKAEKPVTIHQWIEIKTINGAVVTEFYPSNDQLEKERREMDPAPSLIYRRLHFVSGVPADYGWVDAPPEGLLYGGLFTMRIPAEDWPNIFRKERAMGNHCVIKAVSAPRPEAYGPCPCRRCTAKRDLEDSQILLLR